MYGQEGKEKPRGEDVVTSSPVMAAALAGSQWYRWISEQLQTCRRAEQRIY